MKKKEMTHIKMKKEKGDTQNTKRETHRVIIVTKKDYTNKSFFTYSYNSETIFGFLFKFLIAI